MATAHGDGELWLAAFSGAPSANLKPGRTLTKEQREWAQDEVRRMAEEDEKERRQ